MEVLGILAPTPDISTQLATYESLVESGLASHVSLPHFWFFPSRYTLKFAEALFEVAHFDSIDSGPSLAKSDTRNISKCVLNVSALIYNGHGRWCGPGGEGEPVDGNDRWGNYKTDG
ncbi:unnamed protein product, partial [Mesorhabditis belari]|uniref:Uncharacterized protein n=1 Tax=Mesorhabditis belari TaxID=2138241 RepID=A0AAF3F4C9_9BILA